MKGIIPFEENRFYHVVNHAVGSEELFRNDENYNFFLRKYAAHTNDVFETYAYCLMPNHFHLLIRVKPFEEICKLQNFTGDVHKSVMQKVSNLLNSYAKAYNKSYDRKGALFIDYTKRFLVQDDRYFTAVINYIHQNPVNHGFVKKVSDWRHSSFHSFLSDKPTKLMRKEVLEWFGGKDHFVEFHQLYSVDLDEDLEM